MADENKAYKERRNNLKETLSQIKGDSEESVRAREEILAEIETLEANHNAVMDTYQQKFVQIMREKWEREKEIYKDRPDVLSAYEQSYREVLDKYGISWEEFVNTSAEGVESVASDYDYLGQIVKGMTDEAVEANARWESLVWNEKEQKLKTNVDEVLQKAVESEEGWNNLAFILKNATLNSNARELIVEAMSSSDAWNNLTINEKQLIIDGNQAMIEIATSQEMLNQWMALTPEQKQLLAADLTANPTQSAQVALDKVKQTVPADILASDKTATETASAQRAIDNVLQRSPAQILANNRTSPEVSAAQRAIDSIYQRSPVSINAVNNASSAAKQAAWDLNSVPRTVTSTITTFVQKIFKNEKGTDFHPGGLAMVNDQKGSLYRELVTLPNGESFIPEGRNVLLPLPRGARVLKASDTKKLFPHYADGIGFENTGIAKLVGRMNKVTESSITHVVQATDDAVVKVLSELLSLTREGNSLATRLISQGLGISLSIDGEVGVSGPRYNELVNAVSQAIAQELQRKMMLKGMVG